MSLRRATAAQSRSWGSLWVLDKGGTPRCQGFRVLAASGTLSLLRSAGPTLSSGPGECPCPHVFVPPSICPQDIDIRENHRQLKLNADLPCFAGNGTCVHPRLKPEARASLTLLAGGPQVLLMPGRAGAGLNQPTCTGVT